MNEQKNDEKSFKKNFRSDFACSPVDCGCEATFCRVLICTAYQSCSWRALARVRQDWSDSGTAKGLLENCTLLRKLKKNVVLKKKLSLYIIKCYE